ncbi:MAG TPA: glycerol-3-phosphate dehydrogenase/oxidase [Oligoflexia bacterium]|nr:glycerol-3-phosphate dehydrogenase/oxidase [Oligoflexia bacterium]HMP48320.1 glycerol-3-phosphate dehydrogenase/oxidase [Oligoflexia bacterium]
MNRAEKLMILEKGAQTWDLIIAGGGATGLGIMLDAASRGLKTVLLERNDFGSGTSSKSTKLIHGGIRYLKTFDLPHLLESSKEQRILSNIAPHLLKPVNFVIPVKNFRERLWYGMGLTFFDVLTWKNRNPPSRFLSKKELEKIIPNLDCSKLYGGISYTDIQFNDSRFAVSLAKTGENFGAISLNYCSITSLIKENDKIVGVMAVDNINGKELSLKAKTVINSCGPEIDKIAKMDDPQHKDLIHPLQGTHLVLPEKFIGKNSAIIIPETEKKRVLYLIPWNNCTLVGTTEELLSDPTSESIPQKSEIEYLLSESSKYLREKPTQNDIISVFSGIRPLLKEGDFLSGKHLSREFRVIESKSGLITVGGGKWTTYRKMAEVVISSIIHKYPGFKTESITESIKLDNTKEDSNTGLDKLVHSDLPLTWSQVHNSIYRENAISIMDILGRRTNLVYIKPEACIEAAYPIAEFMQNELNFNDKRKQLLISNFISEIEKITIPIRK